MNIILNSLGNIFKLKLLKSRRAAVTILSFIGLLLTLVNSVSLSVVIVAMTNEVNKTLENGTVVLQREFQWDSKEQGLVLSAYYYGFLWTQLLGGMLASKFGGHIVFGIGNGLGAFTMLLLPWMANLGIYYFVAGRIILGSLSGVIIPAVQEIFSKWAPIHERTTMLGIALSGTQSGSFTAFLLSGYIAQYLGWQSVFYTSGSFGVLWVCIWMIFIRKDPASDPRISHEELTYIRENLEDLSAKKNLKTPWKAIFSSSAVYAVIVASFCDLWSRLTFLTEIPNFLNSMVHNDLGTRGLFAAAPYLLCLLLTIAVSPFLDYLRRTIFSTKVVRKLGTVFGFLITATFLIIIPNLRDEKAIVVCLIIPVGVSAVTLVSYMSNPLDIAPNYAAILTGIAQTISSLPGIISPFLTGFIVQNGSQNEWEIVFYISAGFCTFGAIFFAIFAKGEVQEWAKINSRTATELQETQISYPN